MEPENSHSLGEDLSEALESLRRAADDYHDRRNWIRDYIEKIEKLILLTLKGKNIPEYSFKIGMRAGAYTVEEMSIEKKYSGFEIEVKLAPGNNPRKAKRYSLTGAFMTVGRGGAARLMEALTYFLRKYSDYLERETALNGTRVTLLKELWVAISRLIAEVPSTREERIVVAGDPETPPDIITELAREGDDEILMAVAMNPNAPEEALMEVASRGSGKACGRLLERDRLPEEILMTIVDRADPDRSYWSGRIDQRYLEEIVEREDCTPRVLAKIVEKGPAEILIKIAKDPKTPLEILRKLASSNNRKVRAAVASNPRTPPDVLLMLASDGDEEVRNAALRNPNCPRDAYSKVMIE